MVNNKIMAPTKFRSGGILFLTASAIVLTMGLLVLVIDVAWMYFHHAKLQNTVDAAWKAGFDELSWQMSQTFEPLSDSQKALVRTRIADLFRENGYGGSSTRIITNFRGPATWTQTLEVSAFVSIDLYFGKTLDFPIAAVYAERGIKGANNTAGDLQFALPIGLSHGILQPQADQSLKFEPFKQGESFIQGKEYLLRPGNKSMLSDASGRACSLLNHGSLAFEPGGNPGAHEKFLQYGYSKPLTLFQPIDFEKDMQDTTVDTIKALRLSQPALMGRCIFPIVAQLPGNVSSTSPGLLYELNPGQEKVRIIGFGIFDLIPDFSAASASFSLTSQGEGALAGTFLHYAINPFDVQPLDLETASKTGLPTSISSSIFDDLASGTATASPTPSTP